MMQLVFVHVDDYVAREIVIAKASGPVLTQQKGGRRGKFYVQD